MKQLGAMRFNEKIVQENDIPDITVLIPKYPFVDVSVANGAVTLTPYAVSQLTSDGTAFTVTMSGETGKVRDCVFVVDCTERETAPNITWGPEFHQRTDEIPDFACKADAVNVYWITEYAEGQFAVVGWQVTE